MFDQKTRNDLVDMILEANPELKPLLDHFGGLRNGEDAQTFRASTKENSEENNGSRHSENGAAQSATAKVGHLEQENRELREILEDYALALGACDRCFVGLENCPDCGGAGAPGYVSPDNELFEMIVVPTLIKMGWG